MPGLGRTPEERKESRDQKETRKAIIKMYYVRKKIERVI